MNIGDETIIAADFNRIPGRHRYIAMVPQWDFLALLAEAAAEQPTFTLRMNTEFTGLRIESGQVTGVELRNPDGTTETLAATLVLACDARDSRARAAAGLRQTMFEVPMDVWWLRTPTTPGTLTKVPAPLRAINRFPLLAAISAYIGGVGLRPEKAPTFTRPHR